MTNILKYFIVYPVYGINAAITILPLILLLTRKELSHPLRVFTVYLSFKFILDSIGLFMACQSMNTLLICNTWVLVSAILTGLFFQYIFLDKPRKMLVTILTISYVALFSVDLIWSNPIVNDLHNHKYVSFSLPLRSAFILFLCLLFYSELIQELYIKDLTRSAVFWIVSCLLVYHCSALFCTIVYQSEYVWEGKNFLKVVTDIPVAVESLTMILVAIGVMKEKKVAPIKSD